MTEWTTIIKAGMEMIMQGCAKNDSWHNCKECPFNILCTSIYKDNEHSFSTPDCWEEEGVWEN